MSRRFEEKLGRFDIGSVGNARITLYNGKLIGFTDAMESLGELAIKGVYRYQSNPLCDIP